MMACERVTRRRVVEEIDSTQCHKTDHRKRDTICNRLWLQEVVKGPPMGNHSIFLHNELELYCRRPMHCKRRHIQQSSSSWQRGDLKMTLLIRKSCFGYREGLYFEAGYVVGVKTITKTKKILCTPWQNYKGLASIDTESRCSLP